MGRNLSFVPALCAALAAAVLPACNTPLDTDPVTSEVGTTTTLIIVRHAERDEGLDPPLNAEGRNRAAALAQVLEENGVDFIYCPDLARNRETAEAVSDQMGADVRLISALEIADTRAFANSFVDRLTTEHAGQVVLFIGNTGPVVGEQSGNLQELYWRLGGTGSPPVLYRDLYVAVIPDEDGGTIRWIKATYGGESSLD